MRPLLAVLRRDLRLARRRAGETLLGVLFFVLALSLFPFGVGPAPDILARIGGGVIWVLALLSVLLSLDRLWQSDFEDGSLEQLALAAVPLELVVLAKCAAHWLSGGLLLVLVAPLLAVLMAMPAEAMLVLPLTLLLGTPTLTLVGSIGAALLLGARRGGALVALLVLPLYIPVLIFGVSAAEGALMGLGGTAQLLILGAMLLVSAALAPFAAAAALRLALE
ncbi:heme exporter protein CcmB [Marinimicrococcus flavescens]|uniref:Heme exporter protein B n=1 Tax=Marinimicrococcus flavescens TaxID=3031815 RepID=A0AAP3XQG4_9PROT|nr:heme exporter protein CcmB [Marinimicrococcus flavescens]